MTAFPVLTAEYKLTEYPNSGGRRACKGIADCLDTLPWEGFFGERDSFGNVDFNELSMYDVQRNGAVIAEFHGAMASEAYAWLADHRGYAGECGCHAWRDCCDECGGALYDGKCENAGCVRS